MDASKMLWQDELGARSSAPVYYKMIYHQARRINPLGRPAMRLCCRCRMIIIVGTTRTGASIMRRTTFCILVCTLGLLFGTAGRGAAEADTTATRDIAWDEIVATMDLIMQARPHAALAYIDALADTCGEQLLYLMTRARVLQEFVPVDDDRKDYTKQQVEPVIAVLDHVIELSAAGMDAGDKDPTLSLYRGWAWLAKSHMRALCRSFYRAGRDAGQGKGYLEAYLKQQPHDPVANGLLGTFLYFTDAVPSIFKFLSKLLFLPGGDRERGLDMIGRSLERENAFEIDFRLVSANVSFFFEGRHEEGIDQFREIAKQYPAYPRPSIALAAARIMAPQHERENGMLVDELLERTASLPAGELDLHSLNTVRAFRIYGDRLLRDPDMTVKRLQQMIDEAPTYPDWIMSFAYFELGQLQAISGQLGDARRSFEIVVENDTNDRFHDAAKRMLDDIDEHEGPLTTFGEELDGNWIEALYKADGDSLAALERRFAGLSAGSPRAAFYTGECRLLRNDPEGAVAAYAGLLEWDLPAWFDYYRMIAASRIAEIEALSGDYAAAIEYEEEALDHYHNQYRMDWILEGRVRYFKRLVEGDTYVRPTLLSISGSR